MNELLERRALGAVEFVNAVTGGRITEPLRVAAAGAALARNAGGLYVLREAAGLAHHTQAFLEAPADPARESLDFELAVEDPQRRFLPRSAVVKLPRSREAAGRAGAALTPVRVELLPTAAAPTSPNWALLRARVRVPGPGDVGLANALLRVTPQLAGAAPVLAMTDAEGEALVAVPGAPPVLPAAGGGGAVLTREFSAAIQVVLDGQVVQRSDAGAAPPRPDPDRIESRRAAGASGVRSVNAPAAMLAAGLTKRVVIEAAWP